MMFKFIKYLTAIMAWLQIVTLPLVIGVGLGMITYFSNPSANRLVVGITLAVLGLVIGIFWATRVWKTKGTVWFMSRVMATPELDEKADAEK